jgi:hypothetical protein
VKLSDLVKWHKDGDIGIVLGFVQEDVHMPDNEADLGNPIIKWFLHPYGDGIDNSIDTGDPDLEVISEGR